jgi:hypothetical protein
MLFTDAYCTTQTMVIDGYTAPVTAGCFIDLIQKGFYKGLPITRLVVVVLSIKQYMRNMRMMHKILHYTGTH